MVDARNDASIERIRDEVDKEMQQKIVNIQVSLHWESVLGNSEQKSSFGSFGGF